MQENRRSFTKKLAMFMGVGAASVALAGTDNNSKTNNSLSNGVIVGSSRKKEIIYSKTYAWEEYYKTAN